MKRKISLILFLTIFAKIEVNGQSNSDNYIKESTARVAGYKNYLPEQFVDLTNTDIRYFDGFGRPLQIVGFQTSPNKKDVIQYFEYDFAGRESFKFLPYAEQTINDGSFQPNAKIKQLQFYDQISSWEPNIAHTLYPFQEIVYENSVLNRQIERGAPGEDWQMAEDYHTVKTLFGTNTDSGPNTVKIWNLTTQGANSPGYYPPGKLFRVTIRDENWQLNDEQKGVTDEYKNQDGNIILKRVWESNTKSLSTYYVYDDFGNLRYVLPPAVNENGTAIVSSFTESDANFNNFIYGYRYDGKGRLIEKKIPGQNGWNNIIYNEQDQVILTQDPKQALSGTWLFTKYNVFGEVVMTGEYQNTANRADLQLIVDGFNGEQWETFNNSATHQGYNNSSFPTAYIQELTVNYYNTYNFPDNVFGVQQSNETSELKGLVTGSKVKVLGTNTFLLNTNYYDTKGRILRTKSQNYLGGTDEVKTEWSFTDQVSSNTRNHTVNNQTTTTKTNYTYDHIGRKLKTIQQINNDDPVVISSLAYNEIGQLINKKLHSLNVDGDISDHIILNQEDELSIGENRAIVANQSITLQPGFQASLGSTFSAKINSVSTSFLETINYTYNERGWLKSIHSSNFNENLYYNDAANPQYNGNIAVMQYSGATNSSGGLMNKTFNYTYDPINRLLDATSSDNSLNESLSYDVMGNIQSLVRSGSKAANLTYTSYTGNQLKTVTNNGSGFRAYDYDVNGNATSDGMGRTITYDYLNLPQTVSSPNNPANILASYTYDAMGQKLKNIGSDATWVYDNGIVYQNGAIKFIQTEEGKAMPNGGSSYKYVYNITDHLGNVRLSFDDNNGTPRVVQVDEYYAFGLNNSLYNFSSDNRYLYNGKEKQVDLANQYDYGARFYDPVIGRWNVVDPLAEKYMSYSPYVYVGNNPIRRIDPNGMEWEDPADKKKADQISSQLQSREKQLQKQENRLTSRISKAESKGNTEKASKLTATRQDISSSRQDVSTARSEIAAMGADQNKTFAFNELPQGQSVGFLSAKTNGTTVINYVNGAFGNTVHELKHAAQVQQGLITPLPGTSTVQFNKILPVQSEIQAYQRQYSVDPSSLPSSTPGIPSTYNGVNGGYVRGINYTDANGNPVFVYGDPMYLKEK